MKKLILASASPRRRDILHAAGYEFDIVTSDKEGKADKDISPEKFAIKCASEKCEDVYTRVAKGDGAVVLGADTVVSLDGKILGKPSDEEDAERMLRSLSGRTHTVITGYALMTDGMREIGAIKSDVTFNDLTDEVIGKYLDSRLYEGKAGAYGIQDGYGLVASCNGDEDCVIGLPLKAIDSTIKEFLK